MSDPRNDFTLLVVSVGAGAERKSAWSRDIQRELDCKIDISLCDYSLWLMQTTFADLPSLDDLPLKANLATVERICLFGMSFGYPKNGQ